MSPQNIEVYKVLLSFLPVTLVFAIFVLWQLNWKSLLWANLRMLVQLVAVGYVLTFIFSENHPLFIVGAVVFMLLVSAWISLHAIKEKRQSLYGKAFFALVFGATPVLLWVTGFILPNDNWLAPRFFIPLAGMIFANAMNAMGISGERYFNEVKTSDSSGAKRKALQAAFIPQLNSFFAVGLVAIPGMMTGQILSGVDPLIAVRYQIVVMTMVMGSAGLSSSLFLHLISRHKN